MPRRTRRILPASLLGVTVGAGLLVAVPAGSAFAAPVCHTGYGNAPADLAAMHGAACDDAFTVVAGSSTPLDVGANDVTAPGGYGYLYHLHQYPSGGSVDSAWLSDGSTFVYTAPAAPGTYSFVYAENWDNEATVTITVVPAGPSATAVSQTVTGAADGLNAAVDLTPAGWVAGTTAELQDGAGWTSGPVTTSAGSYALDATARTVTFTPATGWSGTDTVTYRLTDANGTATSTVSATVVAPLLAAAQPLTSLARGTRTQSVAVTLPAGGSLKLLDGSGDPVSTLSVPHVGSFAVTGGDLTLAPVSGYTGDVAVGYRVTDAYGQTSDSTYTATVGAPQTSPGATLSDHGVGTAPQHFTLPVPAGSTATLIDGQTGLPTSTWDNGVHGVWRLVGGQVTYTPALGLTGTRTAGVHVTNEYGDVVELVLSADVAAPAAPVAAAVTSRGVGEAQQAATFTVPAGGVVDLLDARGQSTAQTHQPGVGTFVLSGSRVVFVPDLGFTGRATQRYRLTDAYEQTGTGTYTATVTAPAAPAASDVSTTGPAGALQVQTVRVPIGGRLDLLDAAGRPVSVLRVAGQGVYSVLATDGSVRFAPAKGFSGRPTPVRYRVSDAYGQSDVATFSPVVRAGALAAPKASVAQRGLTVRSAKGTVPVTVRVDRGRIASVRVDATATVDGRRQVIGTGTRSGVGGRTTVHVRLNALGKALSNRPGGVWVTARATVRGKGVASVSTAHDAGRVVDRHVKLRTLHFAGGSTKLTAADARYLRSVRAAMAKTTRSVDVVGYADSQSTKAYNQRIGLQRARAAARALLAGQHVASHVSSKGESKAVASNATSAGRALNRRVEITLHS